MTPPRPRAPSTTTAAVRLGVEIRKDLDLSIEDQLAISALVAARPEVGVFMSPAWLSGFFASSNGDHWLVLVREGECLRGYIPLRILETPGGTVVSIVGSELGSDRVDLLAAAGCGSACADALVAWLSTTFRGGLVWRLRRVPADSPLWGAVHREAGHAHLTLSLLDVHVLPYLDREGMTCGWSSLAQHQRWLAKRGRCDFVVLHETAPTLDAFERLVAFLHARWRGHSVPSVLDQPPRHRFHRAVIPTLLAAGYLRMAQLLCGGRTVGVFYGLAAGEWCACYLSGYDRQWAGRIHLGRLTLEAAIQRARQEGARQFDHLEGTERVKYVWPVRERVTLDADLYSDTAGAQLYRSRRATHEAAAALAKSTRAALGRWRD